MSDLKQDLLLTEANLKQDMSDLKKDMSMIESKLKKEISLVELNLKVEISSLKYDIIRWFIGTFFVGMGSIFAFIKLLRLI